MTRILGISPSDSSTNRDLNFHTYLLTHYTFIHLHDDFFFGHPEEQASWGCFVITSLDVYLYSINGKKKME